MNAALRPAPQPSPRKRGEGGTRFSGRVRGSRRRFGRRVIFNAFERMVAFRYLRARRQEGFVSVIAIFSLLGIALGVATLIIVMSVMNGFRADLLGRILGLNGHLGVYAENGPFTDFDAAAQKVSEIPGVTEVTPLIEGQVMASSDAGAAGALVRGIRAGDLRRRPLLADHIVQGSLADFDDDGVAVGDRLARRLGIAVGSLITIISPQGTATAFGTMPRIKTYHVAALFDVGMYEYDNSFIYVPLEAAQLFFRLPDAVNSLEVFVADPDRVREERRQIAAVLGGHVRIVDWQQANSSLFNAVEIERNVMFLILTLIIVVAAFNIISSMIMMVKDKGRDIAILRTMGASRAAILRIFMLSGASIGVVGTLAGLVLGIVFTRNIEAIRQFLQRIIGTDLFAAEIYFFTRIPARIDPNEVAAVVGMALALSFLATLYPSWRAARLDPVEALRYE
jgi:lipoprotein-releasing system permease protein